MCVLPPHRAYVFALSRLRGGIVEVDLRESPTARDPRMKEKPWRR